MAGSQLSGRDGITRRLLEHWQDPEERDYRRFFFCQLEAIETLIWLVEAPPAERQGIVVPGDGGLFRRLCSKMATGTGKTIVMTMLICLADPQQGDRCRRMPGSPRTSSSWPLA